MKRESFKLSEADWKSLLQIAQKTGSVYSGKASWRRLILRIARGELVVSAPAAAAVSTPKPQTATDDFNEKFPQFAARYSALVS